MNYDDHSFYLLCTTMEDPPVVVVTLHTGRKMKPPSNRGVFPEHVLLLLMILLLFQQPHKLQVVDAAHTRPKLVTSSAAAKEPHYDRSITTFNDEGRLLQVEYGMIAAQQQQGSTVAAVTCHNDDNNANTNTQLLVLVVQSSSSVVRIDDHVFMVATGLVGDARFVADRLRQYCQNARQAYGESPTLQDVAQHAAEWQHVLTRMDGARPLGCTCLIVGVDPTPSSYSSSSSSLSVLGPTRIFQTGPGGTMEEYRYCAMGKGSEGVLKALAAEMDKQQKQEQKESNKNKKLSCWIRTALQAINGKHSKNKDDDASPMTVWTIQPQLRARGNLRAICYRGVTEQNLDQIMIQ